MPRKLFAGEDARRRHGDVALGLGFGRVYRILPRVIKARRIKCLVLTYRRAGDNRLFNKFR